MTEHIPVTRRRQAEPNPLTEARKAYATKFNANPSPRLTLDQLNAKLAEPLATPAQPTADAGPEKAPPRRRRASVGGHKLKLTAPERPGYTRRWVNDDGNRIAECEELAYDFVHDPDAKSTDVGSRISRLVGTKANGEPLRAYLMETPDELFAEGAAEREQQHRQIDEALAAGVDSTGQLGPKAETYGQGSIKQDR